MRNYRRVSIISFFIPFALSILLILSGCQETQSKNDLADKSLIEVKVDKVEQSYIFPEQYYSEKDSIDNKALSEIASNQNLLRLGVITESQYENNVNEINKKQADDIEALKTRYFQMDIYLSTYIDFTITNSNPMNVSAIVYFEITTSDLSKYIDDMTVSNIPSKSYLTKSIIINTSKKRTQKVEVNNIVLIE